MAEVVSAGGSDFYRVEAGTPRPVVGRRGELYRYAVHIELGIRVNHLEIARTIEQTLGDKRGWTRGAVRFQRVAEGADTDVYLARPATVDRLCVPLQTQGEVSCCVGRNVVFNWRRWTQAVPHWRPGRPGRFISYRAMLINHEFGHRIGQGHRHCGGEGKRAPVMMQQTYGLQGCLANPWPLDEEVESL